MYEWSLLGKLAPLTFRSDFTSLIPNQGSRQDCHICVNVLIIGGASFSQVDKLSYFTFKLTPYINFSKGWGGVGGRG